MVNFSSLFPFIEPSTPSQDCQKEFNGLPLVVDFLPTVACLTTSVHQQPAVFLSCCCLMCLYAGQTLSFLFLGMPSVHIPPLEIVLCISTRSSVRPFFSISWYSSTRERH